MIFAAMAGLDGVLPVATGAAGSLRPKRGATGDQQ